MGSPRPRLSAAAPAGERPALGDRRQLVRRELRMLGGRRFDPDAALIRCEYGAGGHYVVEESPQYAELLLDAARSATAAPIPHEPRREWWAARPEDRGEADRDMANRILVAIAACQDRDRDSATFGNFRWHRHDAAVHDLNAGVFLAHGLAQLTRRHRDLLDDDTLGALHDALPALLSALRRRTVSWQYTNIHLMTVGGLMQLAVLLDDDAAAADAAERFERWVAGTSAQGFYEWGCPTYTPLAFSGLEAAWAAAERGTELHAQIERALDVMCAVAGAHLLPFGATGGAAARAYPRDLTGRSLMSLLMHVKLDAELSGRTLERCGLLGVDLTLYDYAPPQTSRGERVSRAPHEVRERTAGTRRIHHRAGSLSLASQSLRVPVGHPAPPAVFVVADRCGDPPTVALMPCAAYAESAVDVTVEQRGFTALARLEARADLAGAPESRSPRLLLHELAGVDEVWLDGARWDGAEHRVAGVLRLVLAAGDARIGVVARTGGSPWHLRCQEGITSVELGTLVERSSAAAVLIHVEPESTRPAAAYDSWLAAWELGVGDGVVEAHQHASGECLVVGSERLISVDEPLFIDQGFTLRPGDFEAIVYGRAPVPGARP